MIYSYLLVTDNGSAPCVQQNILSLAICKPRIRKSAKVGDYIIAFSSKSMKISQNAKIIYIAKITNKLKLNKYYPEYKNRKDCIYDNNLTLIKNNYHNNCNIEKDINGKYVLISNEFIYFGNNFINVPQKIKNMIPKYQGHMSKKNIEYETAFLNEFNILQKKYGLGIKGQPIHSIKKNTC